MDTKDKILSVISSIEGNEKSVKTIIDAIEQFFSNLHVEIEDWKISMDESPDGLRMYVRFQLLVKKEEAARGKNKEK